MRPTAVPYVRHRNSYAKGRYSPFDFGIHCRIESDFATFCHEFLHHIQNVTTIHGAERLSAFLQTIAHLSRLCKHEKKIQVPLIDWHVKDAGIHEDLTSMVAHWNTFLYLEQCGSYDQVQDQFEIIHVAQDRVAGGYDLAILQIDAFADGDLRPIPCLLHTEGRRVSAYPLGAYAVCEGAARCVDLLSCREPPVDHYLINEDFFAYHCLPYLFDRVLGFSHSSLAAFLFADLALSMGPPAAATLMLLQDAADLDRRASPEQLLRAYEGIALQHRDVVEFAVREELDNLVDTERLAREQNTVFFDVIEWQVGELRRGLGRRVDNTLYFAKVFVNAVDDKSAIDSLVKEFPPLSVVFEDTGRSLSDEGRLQRHMLLHKLYRLLEFILYDLRSSLDGIGAMKKDGLKFRVESSIEGTFRLLPLELETGKTNYEGLLLQVIGLDEVEFFFLTDLRRSLAQASSATVETITGIVGARILLHAP